MVRMGRFEVFEHPFKQSLQKTSQNNGRRKPNSVLSTNEMILKWMDYASLEKIGDRIRLVSGLSTKFRYIPPSRSCWMVSAKMIMVENTVVPVGT